MKKVLLIAGFALALFAERADAQIYFTKQGKIHFYSKTPMEEIEAANKTVNAVIDAATGAVEFGVTIKGFHFERALMEQHFNENYLESEKYPKATFKGKIDGLPDVSFTKDGIYTTTVTGEMTIHGVQKKMTLPGQIVVEKGKVSVKSKFDILYEDFKIDIPNTVKANFTKGMAVDMEAAFTLKK